MATSKPIVAILIAAYNGERTVRETLSSVLSQSLRDIEIVVCDDDSTDSTPAIVAEVAENDPRVSLVSSNRLRTAGARNAAFEASSKPSLLMFLDQDDLLEKGALDALLAGTALYPSSPVCIGNARVIDQRGESVTLNEAELANYGFKRRKPQGTGILAALRRVQPFGGDEPSTFEELLTGCSVTSVGQVLIRRKAFEQVGRFDEALPKVDDWHLYLKLSRLAPLARIADIVLAWRLHESNASNDRLGMQKSANDLWKLILAQNLTSTERSQARTIALRNLKTYVALWLRSTKGISWKTHVAPAYQIYLQSLKD